MPQLSRRVQLFTDSVIRRMTRISEQYDAINLSQGYPDFDPPRPLLDRLAQVAYEGPHQYSVTYGAQNLREALADKHSRPPPGRGPQRPGTGHLRRHRGHDVRHDDGVQPRGQGDRIQSLL